MKKLLLCLLIATLQPLYVSSQDKNLSKKGKNPNGGSEMIIFDISHTGVLKAEFRKKRMSAAFKQIDPKHTLTKKEQDILILKEKIQKLSQDIEQLESISIDKDCTEIRKKIQEKINYLEAAKQDLDVSSGAGIDIAKKNTRVSIDQLSTYLQDIPSLKGQYRSKKETLAEQKERLQNLIQQSKQKQDLKTHNTPKSSTPQIKNEQTTQSNSTSSHNQPNSQNNDTKFKSSQTTSTPDSNKDPKTNDQPSTLYHHNTKKPNQNTNQDNKKIIFFSLAALLLTSLIYTLLAKQKTHSKYKHLKRRSKYKRTYAYKATPPRNFE